MNTCTVDRDTFDKLPDRSRLTGMPMPNQWYRDSTNDGHVWKWEANHQPGAAGNWVAYVRLEPRA